MIQLDAKIHVMMCSRCYHLNEITRDTCEKCNHDAGVPLFRESAERMRALHMRLLGAGDPSPDDPIVTE